MAIAALSLGSNLYNRNRYLASAVELLAAAPLRIIKLSRAYETEPVECSPQPWFLNQVVLAETSLAPPMLLEFLLGIEERLGRRRAGERGARTLDMDLLFMDALVISTARLTLPHPSAATRRCVMVPLCEVAPAWIHPLLGLSASDLLARSTAPGRVMRRREQ